MMSDLALATQADYSEISAGILPSRLTYLQKAVVRIANLLDGEIEGFEDCINFFEGQIYGWQDYTDENGEYTGGSYLIIFGAPENIYIKIDGDKAFVIGDLYGDYFEYPLSRATYELVEFFRTLYNC